MRKALNRETGGDRVPGEVLAHPYPPEPRADATAGTGGEKRTRAALGTAWTRYLVLKHPKNLAKYVLDQRKTWERSHQRLH